MQNYKHMDHNQENDKNENSSSETRYRSSPSIPGVRPMVDPQADGNVNPDTYPQPKEVTHKIRCKNDLIEYLFGAVDQELLTVKTFYFFFYSAFGSLFPLMGVYFKQMGMNACQCGLLIGLRPFIEFISAPFWGSWADRWQKGKLFLLASLSCWIIFTLPLGFIQPPATSCIIYNNHTSYLYIPHSSERIIKRSVLSNIAQLPDKSSLHLINVLEDVKYVQRLDDNEEGHFDNRERKVNNKTSIYEMNHLSMKPLLGLNEASNKKSKLFQDHNLGGNYGLKIDLIKHILDNNTSRPKSSKYIKNDKTQFRILRNLLFINNTDQNINEYDNRINRIYTEQDLYKKLYDEKEILYKLINIGPRSRRSVILPVTSSGQSPFSVSYANNYKEEKHSGWVKPLFSSIVYKLSDIQKTFVLLLLLIIVGEFFSAPAITLADSAVITLLGEDADRYGQQRMFGSLGWGLAMFFVGIALDHSTAFHYHPCGPDIKEKNYTICFAIFSVLMGAALITATQINFKYDSLKMEQENENNAVGPTREEELQSQLSQQLNLPHLQEPIHMYRSSKPQPFEDKTKMFAQTAREIPEWMTILKQFKDMKCASFLFVAWFMGFGIGLIFTFLFWHLQDYGGNPTLFGVASVINHISEIFAYFFSFRLIRQMGHVKVLCLGLGGNILRFLYISWLKNPWWVLPFEFIQGITHAAVWAACCSYIAHNTPTHLRSSAQSVLQGLHHGLGRGCGAVIGGMFVSLYGTTVTFRAYGLICFIVLAGFIFINFYRKDTGFVSNLSQTEDPHQVAEVTHLAPHGVPSNSIPRALSSSRLHELASQEGYGATYETSDTSLSIPDRNIVNPKNPFLHGTTRQTDIYSTDDVEFIRRSFQNYNEVVNADVKSVNESVVTHLHMPCTNPFHQHDYDW